jgi:hypothetical protein
MNVKNIFAKLAQCSFITFCSITYFAHTAMAQGVMAAQSQAIGQHMTEMGKSKNIISTSDPNGPRSIYFMLENQGKNYLLEASISGWHKEPGVLYGRSATSSPDAVPYMYVTSFVGLFKPSTKLFIELPKLERAAKNGNSHQWTVRYDGTEYQQIDMLSFALCRPDAIPSAESCIFNMVEDTKFRIYGQNGKVIREFENDSQPDGITTNYQSKLASFGVLTGVAQETATAMLATWSRAEKDMQQKQIKETAERSKLDKEKIHAYLKKFQIGKQLFCSSYNAVGIGQPISNVQYVCGGAGSQPIDFDELMDSGLRVANETRSPIEGNAGFSTVSLILEKK